MQMKISQIIIEGVWDKKIIEETVNSDIIPNAGDYIKVGKIEGEVKYRMIDYNTNDITIWMRPRE